MQIRRCLGNGGFRRVGRTRLRRGVQRSQNYRGAYTHNVGVHSPLRVLRVAPI